MIMLQGKLKLYVLDRDSVPGEIVYSSLVEALEASRKVVIILSNAFILNEKCRGLADLAGMLSEILLRRKTKCKNTSLSLAMHRSVVISCHKRLHYYQLRSPANSCLSWARGHFHRSHLLGFMLN